MKTRLDVLGTSRLVMFSGVNITELKASTTSVSGLHWRTNGCTGRRESLTGTIEMEGLENWVVEEKSSTACAEGRKIKPKKEKNNHSRYQVSASLLLIYFFKLFGGSTG